MKLKLCFLKFHGVIWRPLSSYIPCNFQIPLPITHNSDSKEMTVKMNDCSQNLSWLAEYCPEFPISSKNIQVLKEPSEFFEMLKELSQKSTQRITLASLYIGTGPLEKELVACIEESLQKSSGGLKVKILLDYTRGSRGKENSRTLFLPLLQSYEPNLEVSLYHTPKLRGLIKWLLPERWNETIGLSHLKVYLFDDTLLLSGANLSDQYFTNRQDRYIVFYNCKNLCDFFDELVSTVSSMSFLLKPDNSVILHPGWSIHPSKVLCKNPDAMGIVLITQLLQDLCFGSFKEFVSKAHKEVQHFIQAAKTSTITTDSDKNFEVAKSDTLVYPLLQMYTFGIRQDEQVMEKFLRVAECGSLIKLASGYFNLTNHYMNIILKSSKALYSLLVASPKVNGFYGAKGVSGAIPMAYTHIAKTFFSKVLCYKQEKRIELHEYERSSWTFHVKGLWYYKPQENLPSVTFIGSPNFGYRSVYKDLEAQVALVTENKDLQLQLHKEQQRLYDRTTLIDKALFDRSDRKVSLWVKLVTFFIRDYF